MARHPIIDCLKRDTVTLMALGQEANPIKKLIEICDDYGIYLERDRKGNIVVFHQHYANESEDERAFWQALEKAFDKYGNRTISRVEE
jgi:hypothetical protein